MLCLILAILASTGIFVTFKFFDRQKINILQAITINYLVSLIFGFSISHKNFTFSSIPYEPWFLFALIIGITFILMFSIFALSVQNVGITITSVSSKMSVVIPVFAGFILFSDNINLLKLSGIAAALLAFYLTLKRKEKIKLTSKYLIFPLLLFLGNGINDSLLKYAQYNYINNDIVLFLTTVFSVSFILGLSILVVKRLYTKDKFEVKNIIAGIILGLLNWASTYYFIKGLYFLQVSSFVPIFNLGIVVLSTLIGFLIFREKLRPLNWAGIILSVLAILVIAYS